MRILKVIRDTAKKSDYHLPVIFWDIIYWILPRCIIVSSCFYSVL